MLAYHGAEAYHSFTHGGGFYRNFFASLKSGADRSGGGLERLFITGVSPVTMDDVTSGFNIGTNISLEPDFNEMVGFTEADYFGLLSLRGVHGVMPRLAIPNQTVKRLMYGFLRDAYRDVEVFPVNLFRFKQLMLRMATEGEWRPVLEFLSEAIARQTGIRDYIAGEKVIQGFLAAYLSVADYYVFRSEMELGQARSAPAGLARTRGHRAGAAGSAPSEPAARLPDRVKVPEALCAGGRGRGDGGGRRGGGAARAVSDGGAAGAAVSGRALHRPDRGLPRMGAGVLRRRRGVIAPGLRSHAASRSTAANWS